MQTTHFSVVSVVLVAKAAPSTDMSLTWFFQRLQRRCLNTCVTKKTGIQKTHFSVVSVVLVAKAAPNADMSLIRLPPRLRNRYVIIRLNKKPAC